VDYVPATALAPGVVVRDVPIVWVETALYVIRPLGDLDDASVVAASDAKAPPPFEGNEGIESIVAHGKSRPALVLASRQELAIADASASVRVIPIYRRTDSKAFQDWKGIVAGTSQQHLIAMPANSFFKFQEGVLDITQAQPVKRFYLEHPTFRLTKASFTQVMNRVNELNSYSMLSYEGPAKGSN
jgi:hypothetical protein